MRVEQSDGEVEWQDQQMSAKNISTKFFRSRSQSPLKNRRIVDSHEDVEFACLNYQRGRSSGHINNEFTNVDTDFPGIKRSELVNIKHVMDSGCKFASTQSSPAMSPSPSANTVMTEKDLSLHELKEFRSICSSPAIAASGENFSAEDNLALELNYIHSKEAQAINSLKEHELLSRRPDFDDEIFCCNYERYEEESRALARGHIDTEEALSGFLLSVQG